MVLGEGISRQKPIEVTPFEGVDPLVRQYLKPIADSDLKNPQIVDPERLGRYPNPTSSEFLSAREFTRDMVGVLAAKLPDRDDLLVNLDTVGGRLIPYIHAVDTSQRPTFNPDKVRYTAGEFKKFAGKVNARWGKAENLDALARRFRGLQK